MKKFLFTLFLLLILSTSTTALELGGQIVVMDEFEFLYGLTAGVGNLYVFRTHALMGMNLQDISIALLGADLTLQPGAGLFSPYCGMGLGLALIFDDPVLMAPLPYFVAGFNLSLGRLEPYIEGRCYLLASSPMMAIPAISSGIRFHF